MEEPTLVRVRLMRFFLMRFRGNILNHLLGCPTFAHDGRPGLVSRMTIVIEVYEHVSLDFLLVHHLLLILDPPPHDRRRVVQRSVQVQRLPRWHRRGSDTGMGMRRDLLLLPL